MPQDASIPQKREKLSTGANEEPADETIAGTGPGIPDDALAPGEELPSPPSDEEIERAAEAMQAPVSSRRDTASPERE